MAVAVIGTCSMGFVSCGEKENSEEISSDEADVEEDKETEDSSWNLKDGVLKISSNCDYAVFDAPWYSERESIKKGIIDNNVTDIKWAFFYCCNLEEVKIPDSVTNIDSAFVKCTSLKEIEIPNSVTSIGNDAFLRCENLTSVTIPDSVTSIKSGAFWGCENLMDIYVLNPDCEISESKSVFNNDRLYIDKFYGTIHGYEHSTAQSHAETYGYNFEVIE